MAGPVTLLEALSLAGGTMTLANDRDQEAAGIGQDMADLRRSFLLRQGRLLPIDFQRLHLVLEKYRLAAPTLTVLVIEDDASTREMLRRTLEKEGWRVTEAPNARPAPGPGPKAVPPCCIAVPG